MSPEWQPCSPPESLSRVATTSARSQSKSGTATDAKAASLPIRSPTLRVQKAPPHQALPPSQRLRLPTDPAPGRIATPAGVQPPLDRQLVDPPPHLVPLKEAALLAGLGAKDPDELLHALVALPAPDRARDTLAQARVQLRVDLGQIRFEEEGRARGRGGRGGEEEVRGEEVHADVFAGGRVGESDECGVLEVGAHESARDEEELADLGVGEESR